MYPTVHSFARPRRDGDGGGVMATVQANRVTLGVEHFGDAAAPLVLLAGGTTMLSWRDARCEALARGGRHVVRYDLRDSGASTTVDPKAPAYTLGDLLWRPHDYTAAPASADTRRAVTARSRVRAP
jgi:pimeloyl-ACP methyl ester carboxylesterase